jgi:hypothetical protein
VRHRVEAAGIEVPVRALPGLSQDEEPRLGEALMEDDEIGDDAITLLSFALEGPVLSYKPHEDPFIAALLDSGHLTLQPDPDPDYATLHITDVGRDAILGR